jgi:aryl-alcohol dehydrogenase-like predicted oxidoreductase
VSVERIGLAPGYTISRIVKGGWQLAGGHGAVDRARALEDMRRYVDAGITTFDCADIYTGVEQLIGDFLASLRRDRGASSAEAVQVHTKYVPDLDSLPALTSTQVARAVDRSLVRLGVERIDLVQFHWWDYDVPGWVDAAGWLAGLQRAGKIRLLGLTNFDTRRAAEILDAGVPVVSHQVQYSLLDRRPERGMAALASERRVALLCYGGLAGGFLSEKWLGAPAPGDPLENRSLVKYRLVIDEWGGWELFQALLRTLDAVARRHGVTIGAVALRWILDRPSAGAVIVGARHARHLPATLAACALHLDAGDCQAIDRALAPARGLAGDVYELERAKGGRHAAVMRYNLNRSATTT